MFGLEIKTENSAFGEEPRAEIARLLRHIATTLERTPDADHGSIGDHNGNTVGHWYLKESK